MKKARTIGLIVVCGIVALATSGLHGTKAATRITMWHIATEGDPFRPVLLSAIERFNATHPDIQFDAEAIENEAFKARLQDAVSGDSLPDVFQTWGGGLLQNLVQVGKVREIPELSGSSKFIRGALDPSTFNGKYYAVPANMAGIFLWYNEALFQAHNIELPAIWNKFITACRSFRAAGITPVGLGNREKWPGAFWMSYLATRVGGPQVFENALNRVPGASFADPTFVQAGAKIQEAVKAGCFEDGYNDKTFGEAQSLLASSQAAMQLQGDWNLGGLKQTNRQLTEQSIKTLPFPAVEGGSGDPNIMVGGTGQAFAISSKAPPETVSALFELLGSDEFGKSVAQNGFMPALADYEQYISDPIVQRMARTLADAPFMQLYYDQALPPALAQVHLDTTHQLFSLGMTPEEAARKMEVGAQPSIQAASNELPSGSTLRTLAQARDMRVGAAVAVGPLRGDRNYAEILKREFNMVTAENAMKIEDLHPTKDRYDFRDADAIVAFAQANQMQIRGHTLVWYKDLPAWIRARTYSRDEMLVILRDHIMTVVSHYKGKVVAWDVVNEAFDDNGSLRDSIWLRTIGPEYIELAFRWAHEADPNVLLFYNDYGSEGLGPKSDAIYTLLGDFVKRGVPVHGVGLQMHLSLATPPNAADVAVNIDRLAALGLTVHITELDVDMQGASGSMEEKLTAQARVYRDMATVCLNFSACKAIVTWGVTDRFSWIPGGTPLLFDRAYRPKPAYYALMEALARR
jgi:endo-1,4-beta-xylanase